MSTHDYAMSRVRDALAKSDNNHLKAQRLLLSWLEKDQSLLAGLVTPHLHSIVSHALNHVDRPGGNAVREARKIEVKPADGDEFGAALIETLKGGRSEGVDFVQPAMRTGHIEKPGRASQQHVDAINAIVNAGQKDKKK